MKKGAEIAVILGRSGSMAGLEGTGGFSAMIRKQKGKASEAYVSTVLVGDPIEVINDRVDIQKI